MQPYVGFEETQFNDSLTNDPVRLLVMHPTDKKSKAVRLGPYDCELSEDAEVAGDKHPLVIISHGSGSTNKVFRLLAIYLVKKGCIVVMPEHPGNNRSDNSKTDTLENLINRPRHLNETLDFVINHFKYGSHIDETRIFAIGHSIGAYSVLALVGGMGHTDAIIRYSSSSKIKESQFIPGKNDKRVKALVLLAPAVGFFMAPGNLEAVNIPIFVMSGEFDNMTPLFHAEIIKSGVKPPNLVTHKIVANGNHFSFLGPFPDSMKTTNFPPAHDEKGFDRMKFLDEMNEDIAAFLGL